MTYEQKLLERAEAMAKAKYWQTEGDRIPDNWEIEERVKEMIPLATLSLQWSAEDFESGYTIGNEHGYRTNKGLIETSLLTNGLKPQTDGE